MIRRSKQFLSSSPYVAATWNPNWYPPTTNDQQNASSSSSSNPFTVCSYNILAQRFLTPQKFPHLADVSIRQNSSSVLYNNRLVFDLEYRMRMVAEQLEEISPDIVVLQEVAASLMKTENYSKDFSMPSLAAFVNESAKTSFKAMHFPNTKKDGKDYETDTTFDLEGLGMLWNHERFELKESETIKFNPHFHWMYDAKKAEKRCLTTNNVCSLAVFEDKTHQKESLKKLIVAGVHLDYRRGGNDFQMTQLQHIIQVIRRKYGFDKTCPMCAPVDENVAVMILGDFNINGCTDEVFEKFAWDSSSLLPDFTRVEFNSPESEAKIAQEQNEAAVVGDGGVSNLSKKYPFASTLMNNYTTGMWLDHCFYTGTSLQCLQHTGLPTSFESFPILSDTHPSDHVPIAVKMQWR